MVVGHSMGTAAVLGAQDEPGAATAVGHLVNWKQPHAVIGAISRA
jgi:hypothetical protein